MNNRIKRYQLAKQLRKEGKYNGAPLFYSFPRLGKLIPVIPKGKQIMLLGGSGIGKSQLWIGLILLPVYNLIKNYKYKAKFHIFLLEDPIELFEDRLFCRILHIVSKKKYSVDPMELNSMREQPISDEIETYFEETDRIVEDILSYCTVYDSVYNVTGIYKNLRTISGEQGEHIWEEKEFTYKKKDSSTFTEKVKVYKEYKPNDEEEHNIVFVDNLNNFSEEFDKKLNKSLDIRSSMGKWCRDYSRLQIVKHWDWTVINICQTALESDKKQFDNRGGNIIEKLEPNLSFLGDNKIIARDHHLILGLFSPTRFGIEQYENYRISQLDDAFRALIILKSNFSIPNRKIPLYFNGASSYFKELPLPNDMSPNIYKQIEHRRY